MYYHNLTQMFSTYSTVLRKGLNFYSRVGIGVHVLPNISIIILIFNRGVHVGLFILQNKQYEG